MTIEDGGPAFPVAVKGWDFAVGMSLRDYFAAKVLASCMNAPISVGIEEGRALAIAAHSAYKIADAMLKARKA